MPIHSSIKAGYLKLIKTIIMIPMFSSENAIKEKKIPVTSCHQSADVLNFAHVILALSFLRTWSSARVSAKGLLNGLGDIFV